MNAVLQLPARWRAQNTAVTPDRPDWREDMDKATFDAYVRERFDPEAADPGIRALYAAALSTLDEISRIEAELADAPLTLTTKQGVTKSHPLLDQAIRHRIAFGKMCTALFQDAGSSARSARARRAADARWGVAS
jgi:hypothetical protein